MEPGGVSLQGPRVPELLEALAALVGPLDGAGDACAQQLPTPQRQLLPAGLRSLLRMRRPLMGGQTLLPGEGALADAATMPLLVRMPHSAMLGQCVLPREGNVADDALVGLLLPRRISNRVFPTIMFGQSLLPGETSLADWTAVELLVRMSITPMSGQIRLLGEGRVAEVALVGLLAGVDAAPVSGESCLHREGQRARIALEGPLLGVGQHVGAPVGDLSERLAALTALVRLVARVCSDVHHQTRFHREGHCAEVTLEETLHDAPLLVTGGPRMITLPASKHGIFRLAFTWTDILSATGSRSDLVPSIERDLPTLSTLKVRRICIMHCNYRQ